LNHDGVSGQSFQALVEYLQILSNDPRFLSVKKYVEPVRVMTTPYKRLPYAKYYDGEVIYRYPEGFENDLKGARSSFDHELKKLLPALQSNKEEPCVVEAVGRIIEK
jgi:hypothetical protein